MEIHLKPFQFDFIYSKARYPAFVGGWATGKTLCGISRALIYSKAIPNNLGVIFRKTARSLFDSTLKDFEKYTKLKVDSQRNYNYNNGSTIMFRHIDEINDINQQNINLGWFMIEQGDELESDKEFFTLFGRLRRNITPTDEFVRLGLPVRSGWVIANAGDHWMKQLWKEKKLEEAELIEATTLQNSDILPADFISSLKILEKNKPEIYKSYVLNDWDSKLDQFILINRSMIELLKTVTDYRPYNKRIISCDPATGGDACSIYVFENTKIIDNKNLYFNDTMKIVGELMILGSKYNIKDFAIDSIGIGKGICDRLMELKQNVIYVNSAQEANDKERFYNRRAEMWWYLLEKLQAREIHYFNDEELIRQLTAIRYKVLNSNGKIQLEPKEETKKRIDRSPDNADAFVYGIWGLSQIENSKEVYFNDPMNKKRVHDGAGGW